MQLEALEVSRSYHTQKDRFLLEIYHFDEILNTEVGSIMFLDELDILDFQNIDILNIEFLHIYGMTIVKPINYNNPLEISAYQFFYSGRNI